MHGYGMPRLYVSNSSIQQPDSQVKTVQCALRELELLLLIRDATDQRLCCMCWSRLVQQVHTLSLRLFKLTTRRTQLRDIPVNFSLSLGLMLDPGLSSRLGAVV